MSIPIFSLAASSLISAGNEAKNQGKFVEIEHPFSEQIAQLESLHQGPITAASLDAGIAIIQAALSLIQSEGLFKKNHPFFLQYVTQMKNMKKQL